MGNMRFANLAVVVLGLALWAGPAGATCPTFHTLANQTPANANDVMDNFNYILGCPYFTGNVGIGSSPGAGLLDLTGASTSSATAISIRFLDIGSNAASRNWIAGNGAGTNY